MYWCNIYAQVKLGVGKEVALSMWFSQRKQGLLPTSLVQSHLNDASDASYILAATDTTDANNATGATDASGATDNNVVPNDDPRRVQAGPEGVLRRECAVHDATDTSATSDTIDTIYATDATDTPDTIDATANFDAIDATDITPATANDARPVVQEY